MPPSIAAKLDGRDAAALAGAVGGVGGLGSASCAISIPIDGTNESAVNSNNLRFIVFLLISVRYLGREAS
jgi:hypothetical protein